MSAFWFCARNALSLLIVVGIVYSLGGDAKTAALGWLTSVALTALWKAENAEVRS